MFCVRDDALREFFSDAGEATVAGADLVGCEAGELLGPRTVTDGEVGELTAALSPA